MGQNMDREFLASDLTVSTLCSLSRCHATGLMYVSAGRILVQRQLVLKGSQLYGELEKTHNTLERLATLGLADRVGEKFRLSDGTVTTVQQLPECDVCKLLNHYVANGLLPTLAIADARTQTSRWGYVCAAHFVSEGCFLGIGRGQILTVNS